MSPRPQVGIRDRALLLRRVPYGNTSLVVHVLTPEHGRRELMAKGAYRAKSRLSGVLDWFDELELVWTEPRERRPRRGAGPSDAFAPVRDGLGQVREGALLVRRRALTRSLPVYRAASAMTDLVEIATRFGVTDASFFRLLGAGYDALAKGASDAGPPDARSSNAEGVEITTDAVLAAFELHLANELGLAPALLACAVCGEDASPVRAGEEPRAAFSATLGGRLCAAHAQDAHSRGVRVGTLPVRTLEAAARLASTPLAQARSAWAAPAGGAASATDPSLARRVLDLTGRFLDRQLETRPKSRAGFLSAPDRNRAPR